MNRTPTLEQEKIIRAVATRQTLKIAALAGTGKTSTLVMIANAYPSLKGLYLAYNAALKKEALGKFPPWIECKTIHGLAYQEFGKPYHAQLSLKLHPQTLIVNLEIEEMRANFKIKGEPILFTSSQMARLTKDVVRRFTYSAHKEILLEDIAFGVQKDVEEEFPEFKKDSPEYKENTKDIDLFLKNLCQRLLDYARDLWKRQCDKDDADIPCEHDTYLKLYQLSKPIIRGYDLIMLDEAQDANPCILDILIHQTSQIIYVGDKHQQIYAFRGTINAMDKIQGETYFLTQSFRFGDEIAKQANTVLKNLGSQSQIKGLSSIPSLLGIPQVPYTFLARTNLTLLGECILKIEQGWKCCLLADTRGIVSLIRSTFYLWMKKTEWVKDERVMGFENWTELVEFARETEEAELLLAINFILKNGGESLDRLRTLEDAARTPEHKADIIFSTAHKAKGREWERVVLADDFTFSDEHEMNIYYVAITRASRVLHHVFPKISG